MIMIMSILSVFMIVFQRFHYDISDINTPNDYKYDHCVTNGNQALMTLYHLVDIGTKLCQSAISIH